MAGSNKKGGSEINRFLDIYHGQNDDADENEDQPVDFDYHFMNFGRNEQIIPVQLESNELDETIPVAAAASTTIPQEEGRLSQQFPSGTKRPVLTPSTPTRAATAPKKLKVVIEQPVDDAPQYLSLKSKFFERFIVPIIEQSGINLPMETLRSIAILKHKLALVDLNQTLWTIYLQSGMGHLKVNQKQVESQTHLPLWPKEVKMRMVEEERLSTTSADMETVDLRACLSYVHKKLEQLQIQQTHYQGQLEHLKQTIHPHFTSEMEKTIDQFVEQHGIINTFQNLLQAHLAKETTKMDVAMLKQRIVHNYLPDNIRTFDLPRPEALDAITDEHMRLRLIERYDKILQRTISDMTSVQLATMEVQMNETEKKFNNDMAQFKADQVHGPTYKKLTKTMCDIMNRCFTNQSQRILTIYKIQLRFFVKAPTDMN
ncbi:hypothetical protein I4U23_017155 [Adineta vaga]|nr:hypothetical protein I4U23_017155 [Adineta vaga]